MSEREDFEKWYITTQCGNIGYFDGDDYDDQNSQLAWSTYQAASELKNQEIKQLLKLHIESESDWRRLFTEKDEEIIALHGEKEQLKANLAGSDYALQESRKNDMEAMRQLGECKARLEFSEAIIAGDEALIAGLKSDIEQLQAKLAMCVELLNNVTFKGDYLECQDTHRKNWFDLRQEALSATEQDVSKWKLEVEAKAIEECLDALETMNAQIKVDVPMLIDSVAQLAQQKRSER